MANYWIALADKYLERQHMMFTRLLKVSDGNGSLSAADAAAVGRSRARFAQFLELFYSGSGATATDLESFRNPTAADLAVFEELLGDVLQMHFVKVLAEDAGHVSPALIFGMVRGAVYTVNPSSNRIWIERATQVDPEQVGRALLWFLENGTAFEVGGAANAFYWFDAPTIEGEPKVDDTGQRRSAVCLRRFVETEDVDVRRCLVGRFSWRSQDYSEPMHDVLDQARVIAARHPDEYIHQRFLYDIGRSALIPCLPHRDLAAVIE